MHSLTRGDHSRTIQRDAFLDEVRVLFLRERDGVVRLLSVFSALQHWKSSTDMTMSAALPFGETLSRFGDREEGSERFGGGATGVA